MKMKLNNSTKQEQYLTFSQKLWANIKFHFQQKTFLKVKCQTSQKVESLNTFPSKKSPCDFQILSVS